MVSMLKVTGFQLIVFFLLVFVIVTQTTSYEGVSAGMLIALLVTMVVGGIVTCLSRTHFWTALAAPFLSMTVLSALPWDFAGGGFFLAPIGQVILIATIVVVWFGVAYALYMLCVYLFGKDASL